MNVLSLQFLFNKTQAALFERLFDSTNREVYLREMVSETGLNPASLIKELDRLTEMSLLQSRKSGNRIYYHANTDHFCYQEIASLVLKLNGWVNRLRETLLADKRVKKGWIFGSYARSEMNTESDIDLLIIGNLSLRELVQELKPLAQELNRELNPKLYQEEEWEKINKETDTFIGRIFSQPTIILK